LPPSTSAVIYVSLYSGASDDAYSLTVRTESIQ
jgi:hypothetical protein